MKTEEWKKIIKSQTSSEVATTKKGEPIIVIGPVVPTRCPKELVEQARSLYDNPKVNPADYKMVLFKKQRDLRIIRNDTIGGSK
jgi:hypothetical protein